VAAPLVAALVAVRPALDQGRDRGGRLLAGAAALLALALSAVPAVRTILPGAPLFAGDVGIEGEGVAVPSGVGGRVKLLVSGKLPQAGDPSVAFAFGGTERPLEGKLERTYGYARVGRAGRARVTHDHTSDWYEGTLRPGATELRLDRLQGQLAGRLQVSVYRDWLPHSWLLALSVALLLVAAAADARLGLKGNVAVPVGMSLAFGLLVAFNATPAAAVGPAVGGVVLGAMLGALAGAVAGLLARKIVPAARRRTSPKQAKTGGAAAA
jgi:hypothetical protein